MGEEIFGDKSPHQVSVSEGSGNAASSRNRSGKFKADTSRRINLDGDEGELAVDRDLLRQLIQFAWNEYVNQISKQVVRRQRYLQRGWHRAHLGATY